MTGEQAQPGSGHAGRPIAALVLLVPFVGVWGYALVLPLLQTFWLSLHNVSITGPGRYVGLANYRALVTDGTFAGALGFTAQIAMVRLGVVVVAPLFLALAIHEFRRWVGLPARLIFTIPLALYSPVIAALIWRLAYNPGTGLFDDRTALSSPTAARITFLRVDALNAFGIACGLGLIVYLIALRRGREPGSSVWRALTPLLVVALIVTIATLALSLQSLTLSYLLTNGGPGNRTTTLGLLEYRQGFQNLRLGIGASLAMILLIAIGFLGLLAGVLVIASGLRLESAPAERPGGIVPPAARSIAGLLLAGLLLGAVVLLGLALWPYLWTLASSFKSPSELAGGGFFAARPTLRGYTGVLNGTSVAARLAATLLPPLLSALLIQLPPAYLAAFGIGGLRPLGRHSEWLLLPFAPFLFVTTVPLGIAGFDRLRSLGLVNSAVGLLPPPVMMVPCLVILTLFFKGRRAQWVAAGERGDVASPRLFQALVLPSLPLAALLAVVAIAIGAQELFWPLLVSNSPTLAPAPVWLVRLLGQQQVSSDIFAALVIFGLPAFLVSFVVYALFQLFLVERLALAVET